MLENRVQYFCYIKESSPTISGKHRLRMKELREKYFQHMVEENNQAMLP